MGRRRRTGLGWLIFIGVLTAVVQFVPHSSAPTVTSSPSVTSTTTPARPAASAAATIREVRYVAADVLNLRASPSTSAAVVAKLILGRELVVLAKVEGWLEVEADGGTRGWVSSDYVSTSKPRPRAPMQAAAPVAAPAVDRAAVVQQIIRQSISAYPGNCPCPYNTDRAGRSCGRRSAWSKAGGYAPLWYAADVTDSMIRDWVARH